MDEAKQKFLDYMHETPEERKARREKNAAEGRIDGRDMLYGHMHLEKETGRYYEAYDPGYRMSHGTMTIYGLGNKSEEPPQS